MKLKKNDCIELNIADVTNLGFGVARCDGAVIFVADTVMGDRVLAKIIKVTSSYAVGRVEKYLEKSPVRDTGRCSNVKCRSCAYKLLGYGHELELKQELVRQAFIKEGLTQIAVLPTVPSPKQYEYRNKAQYPIKKGADGEYIIGFYAPKSHNVCEAADCPLSTPEFSEILNTLRHLFKKYGLSVYNEEMGEGLLRHIYLRRGELTGEILLTLVIAEKNLPHSDEIVSEITARHPQIVGILLNFNYERTNVILGEEYRCIFGRDYIEDILCGVRLKISAPSFYQVNHGTAELIYGKARELARLSKTDTLLDLYCGTGSIGLSMAKDAGELIGIEIVPEAIECAKHNARINGIENAKFYAGDATKTEKLLLAAELDLGKKIKADVVILDPPRGGSTEELLSYVDSLNPKRIVYISCNPTTLARDMKFLLDLGYTASEVTPYDMFPMTGHVETVALLSRQKVDEHIYFDVNVQDLPKTARTTATYPEIKAYVKDKYGLNVTSLNIAQVKEKHGFEKRENYNKGKDGHRVPNCPPEKEKAIEDAFKHFGML